MLRSTPVVLALLLAACTFAQQRPTPLPVRAEDNPALAELQVKTNALLKEGKYQELMAVAPANRQAIIKMLEKDELTTATDFLRASEVFDDPGGYFENRRTQHEFALMALVLGSREAPAALRRTWDFLMVSMGRRQRLGFVKSTPAQDPFGKFLPDLTPLSIRRVFDEPAEAQKLATTATDNAEIKKMREEDQALRTGTVDFAKLQEKAGEERARQLRALELLSNGVARTPNDFESLGLVLQHGGEFDSYKVAHECLLAAIILGYKTPNLVVATYDRMLLSVGHRQRFATQWWQSGLAPVDTLAFNDRMRLQMGIPKLAELKEREAEILKRFFGGG